MLVPTVTKAMAKRSIYRQVMISTLRGLLLTFSCSSAMNVYVGWTLHCFVHASDPTRHRCKTLHLRKLRSRLLPPRQLESPWSNTFEGQVSIIVECSTRYRARCLFHNCCHGRRTDTSHHVFPGRSTCSGNHAHRLRVILWSQWVGSNITGLGSR